MTYTNLCKTLRKSKGKEFVDHLDKLIYSEARRLAPPNVGMKHMMDVRSISNSLKKDFAETAVNLWQYPDILNRSQLVKDPLYGVAYGVACALSEQSSSK